MMKIMAADWKLWMDTHSDEDNGCRLAGYGWIHTVMKIMAPDWKAMAGYTQ